MPYFYVSSIDSEGKKVSKFIFSDSEVDLLRDLKLAGLSPISIIKIPEIFSNIIKFSPIKFKKVKLPELAELFDNLHVISKSGIPIITGINDIAESSENKYIRYILKDITAMINSGASISEAFRKHTNIFGPIAITLINIGEETGNLDRIFKDISSYYKRIHDIKSKTKQALIYPAFSFFGIFGAMLFWMIYVLPKIVEAFKNFDMELPLITRFLIWSSEFLRQYFLVIVFIIIFILFLIKLYRGKNRKFKFITDRIMLRMPVIGVILLYFYYAFISEYMRVLIKSGVNIVRSIEIIKSSLYNEVFKEGLTKSLDMIIDGSPMARAFKEQGIFSPMIIRMIDIGENAGSLEEQFEFISSYYYERLDYITQNIAKMIEPIVMIFVGIFMLIIILGLMGPIYDLISKIGKSA